ncbi:MAG TPA: GerAB/ArcD/ProY family transporter [Bacillus sp. (in: firmicutes)]|nr:GerAB/ArcD/ProY family transporter [Bacillus sp. (in: firmicutes)]
MSNQVKSTYQVSPFMVFFMIHSAQVGVGILTFPRSIAKEAGYDSWLGVIVAGLLTHLSLFIIFRLLKHEHQGLSNIHRFVYGKWLGRLFTFVFIVQFLWSGLAILREYVRVIQVWMFPSLPTWLPTLLILVLLYYTIAGGFRVMVGMCFFKVIIAAIITFPVFFTLRDAALGNFSFIPVHAMKEIWSAAKTMAFSYIGFEMILVYYPFIQKGQKSKKYAYLANATTTLLYLVVTFMCFLFYSEKQLSAVIWPYLKLSSSLEFSIIQRFEYIFVSAWILVIVPCVILYLWCASRLAKDIFKVKQKYPLLLFMLIYVVISHFVDDSEEFQLLGSWSGKFAFYTNYVYIPVLFILYMVMRKIKRPSPSS